MTPSEPPTAALIAFPGRVVLSRPDASRYLGIGQNALLVMKLLACGPRSISMDRKTLYREEDLDQFRQTLIGTVGVAQADTPYKKLEPDTEEAAPAPVDPLMCLLVRHLIKRRMILIFLWSMVLVGGLMSLTLF